MDGSDQTRVAWEDGDGRTTHGLLLERNSMDVSFHLAVGNAIVSGEQQQQRQCCRLFADPIAGLDWIGRIVLLGLVGGLLRITANNNNNSSRRSWWETGRCRCYTCESTVTAAVAVVAVNIDCQQTTNESWERQSNSCCIFCHFFGIQQTRRWHQLSGGGKAIGASSPSCQASLLDDPRHGFYCNRVITRRK
jgi:hypothetical protein